MHVTFYIKDAKTNLGESLFLVGNKAELGGWDVSNWLIMYVMIVIRWIIQYLCKPIANCIPSGKHLIGYSFQISIKLRIFSINTLYKIKM
jgi:hypothetical protein